MKREPSDFDQDFLISRTERAKRQVDSAIKRARSLEQDSDRDERLRRHLCKACHYFTKLAGQAITTQPCSCCGVQQTYASTDTDIVCAECAQEHEICKHCGGDREMRTDRRDWPTRQT